MDREAVVVQLTPGQVLKHLVQDEVKQAVGQPVPVAMDVGSQQEKFLADQFDSVLSKNYSAPMETGRGKGNKNKNLGKTERGKKEVAGYHSGSTDNFGGRQGRRRGKKSEYQGW